jgi:hypothetical protein
VVCPRTDHKSVTSQVDVPSRRPKSPFHPFGVRCRRQNSTRKVSRARRGAIITGPIGASLYTRHLGSNQVESHSASTACRLAEN